jgi:hypothetical protein
MVRRGDSAPRAGIRRVAEKGKPHNPTEIKKDKFL